MDIKMWQQRISRAEDLQAEKTGERKQILRLYTGTFFGKPTDNNTELSEVNFVFEFVKVLIASIYARNPFIFVRTRISKWGAFAETMETVINYFWRELKLKAKIKQAILDTVLQPPGFIGIGYTLLTEKKKIIKDIENEFPQLKDNEKKEKTEAEQGILDETIKEDNVFAEFISSWDILWPDGYHDIRSVPYIFRRQKVPLVDLLNNPFYKKSAIEKLRKSKLTREHIQKVQPYRMQDNPQIFPLNDDGYMRDTELVEITLYHGWDKRSQSRFTLAKGFNEETLFEGEWNYLIDGFPFYPLIFNEIPQTDDKANSYPMSDVVPMLPQLKELSYISSAMLRHRKRAGTILIGKKGSLSPTEITNIQNSGDMDLVLLDEVGENVLRGFTPPSLPNEFYNLRSIILEDLMRISGFAQLLYNVKGVETATESENVRAGAMIRQSEKADIIEDYTVDIARGLAGLIWQFKQNKREIEEIIGEPVSEEMWPNLPKDMNEARRIIQKELNFRIDAGSTRPPKDEALERKQWENVAGILKANFPGRIKDDVFLTQFLKKYDFKDIDKMVISFDDEEINTAQQENKNLMQGIPQLVHPNDNDLLHLQAHSQVYQTPGLQPTQQLDEHVDTHAKNMERKNPKANPQRGDTKLAPQTTTPEIRRQGVPEYADMLGAITKSPGIGGNKGGG